MYDTVFNNFKKNVLSILPIIIIVLILSIYFNIDTLVIIRFLSSSLIVLIGLTLFTTGADIALIPIGEEVSKILLKKGKLWLILLITFLLGIFITILEPEFLTISQEANGIPYFLIIFFVSFGIGVGLVFAVIRIFKRIQFKFFLIFGYILIFLLLIISNFNIVPFAFDMASVTAGAISSPFILSLGIGFTSFRNDQLVKNDQFGLISLCSIGPIIMILILSLFYKTNLSYDTTGLLDHLNFFETFKTNFFQIILSLTPIIITFIIFTLISKNKIQDNKKIIVGLIFILFGLTLFLTGTDVGYFKIGYLLGTSLSSFNPLYIIIIGGVLGLFISKIEPSVKVLIQEVNDVTNGKIKAKLLEKCLSVGTSISVILCLFVTLNNLNILIVLIPSYFLAILLAFITPNQFLTIAFDSGGVISGNMITTFLLPLLVGLLSIVSNNYLELAFGFLSLVSIIPVIIIEIVGLLYNIELESIDTSNLDVTIINYGEYES